MQCSSNTLVDPALLIHVEKVVPGVFVETVVLEQADAERSCHRLPPPLHDQPLQGCYPKIPRLDKISETIELIRARSSPLTAGKFFTSLLVSQVSHAAIQKQVLLLT